MEQLSRQTVRRLLSDAQARQGAIRSPAAPAPAQRSWVDPAAAGAHPATPAGDPTGEPARNLPFDGNGVERRLVRRAEAFWARQAADLDLPGGPLALDFARAPFADKALIIDLPAGRPAAVRHCGEDLRCIADPLQQDPAQADAGPAGPRSWLGAQLLALGQKAAATGHCALFDSDHSPDVARTADPLLLVRAIALPYSGDCTGGPGAAAVVVASWRKLLSAEETRALHRELAAAIDWMHQQGG